MYRWKPGKSFALPHTEAMHAATEGNGITLRGSGSILIVCVLATLVATLSREIERPENKQKA